jgi:NADPH2:quinone reductase
MQSKVAIFKPEEGVFEIINEQIKDTLSPDEVLIRQTSISMSDVDVVDAKFHKLTRLGHAAEGEVMKIGDGVTWLNVGDRVVYCAVPGAFCEYRVVNQSTLIKVQDNIAIGLAPALFYRGCVGHMATARAFIVRGGINALVDNIHNPTNAAIGLFAKQRGAFVIGITSENSEISQDVCDVVVHSNSQDIKKDIMNVTKNIGCHVYYTGLNPISFEQAVDYLTVSGVIVDHLNIIQDLQTSLIAKKSLFFTAPSILHYKSIRNELVLTADEVMSIHSKTPFQCDISEFSFDKINDAFREVLSPSTARAIVLKF